MTLIDQAIALHQAKNSTEAESLYKLILEADSRDFDALHLLGVICAQRQQFEEAERLIRNALAIVHKDPHCYHNYGHVLAALNRFEDAIDNYNKALAIAPNCAPIYVDRGKTQQKLGRGEDALASFTRALAIDPDLGDAHLYHGLCQLLRGDFERGWAGYEWRWQTEDFLLIKRDFQQPLWRGHEDIAAKTILLHAEQGFGDTIQFCRFADSIAAKGAKVVLEVQPPLKSLLTNTRGVERILGVGERLPSDFDYHCPLMSLPLALGTRIDTIPADVPYLKASPNRKNKWLRRLGNKDRPRVGIAWSGGAMHPNDHNRSIGLSRFLPFTALELQLVSLQREVREQDQSILDEHDDIVHFGDQLGDFSDTAALVSLMDIVISVDTSVAHLAGALGAPTWVLLPFVPDWRWLLDLDDSPWYPTVRLFRQPKIGDWERVTERVLQELKHWIEQHSS